MSAQPDNGILVGTWTYRSFLNDPDVNTSFNDLEFGVGNIRIDPAPMNEFKGLIYGSGWQLNLYGSINYGYPFVVRFQGKGVVGGEEWIYDYLGFMSPIWPNGVDQRPALVGTIVRTIPHSSGSGGVSPAGVVASWIAVKDDPVS
ncbi:MAG TPA: hypothetical protein VJX67_19700 [Blastocatellia bacterium]|nr:hypothetical protein [Blastocatellia bacterium]